MKEVKYVGEKDLIYPVALPTSGDEWMQLVERRLAKKSNFSKWSAPLIAATTGLIVLAGIVLSNEQYQQKLLGIGDPLSQEELIVDEQNKAEFLASMAHPYQNISTLTGTGVIKNGAHYQKLQFLMTRDEKNEPRFSFVTPGATGAPNAAFTKAMQTIVAPFTTFSWLAVDLKLWSFKDEEAYLTRKAHVLEGQVPFVQIQKVDAAKFKLWVDTETGMVLKKELSNNSGDVVESFEVTSLRVGIFH